MLKNRSIVPTFLILTLTILLFGSCIKYESNETIVGSGKIISQTRNIKDNFQKIEVENNIILVIEQSDKTEIIVIADEEFQKDISTKVKNGKLIISNREMKTSFSFFRFKRNFSKNVALKKVIVKLPKLEFLEAKSAATIKNNGIIKSDYLELKTSSAATMNLNTESDKIKMNANSGSSINAEGLALSLEINSTSGSIINAEKLLANEITANSKSGSSIYIYPIVTLIAEASSGSQINYMNIPKTIQKTVTSGANITKM